MAIPSSNESGIFGDINITPLTDIFLVLLIIFMVGAAVAIESAAHVGLPQATAPDQQPDSVIVTLTEQRRIYIDQAEVGLNELQPVLQRAMERSHEKLVIFKGDPKIILGDMVMILDIAQRAGARQLGVAVAEAVPGDATTGDVPKDAP